MKQLTGEPLYDRVIIQRKRADTQAGSIIIPEQARERPSEGTVVAGGKGRIGQDGNHVPMTIQTGDLVLFGKYAGQDIRINGQDFVIVREDEIMLRLVEVEVSAPPAVTPSSSSA